MDVVCNYTCECNGRNYFTKAKLTQHKKTKGHVYWENSSELRDLKIKLTTMENKIHALQTDKRHLQDLNLMLMKKINCDTIK